METELPLLNRWQKHKLKEKYYELLQILAKNIPPKALMRNLWVNMMIERIQSSRFVVACNEKEKLNGVVKDVLSKYEISYLKSQNQYILLKKSYKKSKPSAIVFPLEKSFEVTFEAHMFTNHGGINAMEEWLYDSNYIVSAICPIALVSVCQNCAKEYGPKSRHNYSSYSIVNILDMTSQPDNSFQFLMVYIDFNTNFIQLRPITGGDLVSEISMELLRLINDFEIPPCVVVQKNWSEVFQMVLQKINVIVSEDIQLETDETDHPLTWDASDKVNEWMKQNCDRWSVGCQFVQWEMNKLKKNDDSPYQKFFRLGPKYYKAKTSDTKTTDLLNSAVPSKDANTFPTIITVSDDDIESDTSSNSSHLKNPDRSKASSSIPNTAKRKAIHKSKPIQSKKVDSNVDLIDLVCDKASSSDSSTVKEFKILDSSKPMELKISDISSLAVDSSKASSTSAPKLKILDISKPIELRKLANSSRKDSSKASNPFPNTAKLKILDISKPINFKKSDSTSSPLIKIDAIALNSVANTANRCKILDISKPSCSKVTNPNQEVIRSKNGLEVDEKETRVCFTCGIEMPAKETYLCCICSNSLHLYCGARRQGDNNFECICFMCLNLGFKFY